MHVEPKPQRVLSIDAFRGITILVMVFVNELAGVRDIPQWMKHMPANADAMTFVDLVFPAFLFIVGMSIPFALNNRLKKGDRSFRIMAPKRMPPIFSRMPFFPYTIKPKRKILSSHVRLKLSCILFARISGSMF